MVSDQQHQLVVAQNQALQQQLQSLQVRFDQRTRMLLGKKSERFTAPDKEAPHLGLFDPAAAPGTPPAVAADAGEAATSVATGVAAHTRKSRADHPGRAPLPEHLSRRIELIEPAGITGVLTAPGHYTYLGYDILGTEVSERLVVVPADIYVLETHRVRLLHRRDRTIHLGELPDRVLAKSLADESLGTDVVVKKYVEHQPLHRQAETLLRDYQLDLSRATMGGWVDRIATTLRPVYGTLRRQVLTTDYIQMDESGILVLAGPEDAAKQPRLKSQKSRCRRQPDGPARRHQGYMWLARDPVGGAILFEYHPGRDHALPLKLLEDYEGYLQVDGYGAYRTALNKLGALATGRVRIVPCLVHIRRKFFEAKSSHPQEAEQALQTFRAIYRVEKEARKLDAVARLAYRREHLRPLFDAFAAWLESYRDRVLPKGLFATAIGYGLNQWPLAEAMLEDGRIELDNNGIESQVRPLALGRKNYLFCGSHHAAENAAVLYSLMATCKARGVNPREWLLQTLRRILTHPINRIEELLPGYTPPPAHTPEQ